MLPDFSFGIRESNSTMEPLCHQQYWTQSGLCKPSESVCDQFLEQNLVSEVFFSQHQSKNITNFTYKNLYQGQTKESKTRFPICKLDLNFLRSWSRFNCDAAFDVVVLPLNEFVHGFNITSNRKVKNGFPENKF